MPVYTNKEVLEFAEKLRSRLGTGPVSILRVIDLLEDISCDYAGNDEAWLQFRDVLRKAGRPDLIGEYDRWRDQGEFDQDPPDSDDESYAGPQYEDSERSASPVQEIHNSFVKIEPFPRVHFGPRNGPVYSRNELYSMIPPSEEFKKLRELLRLEKTVTRYDPSISNRKFEHLEFKLKGWFNPADHRKVDVVLRGQDLDQVYGRHHPFSGMKKPPFGGKPVSIFIRTTKTRVYTLRVDQPFSRAKRTVGTEIVTQRDGKIVSTTIKRPVQVRKQYRKVMPSVVPLKWHKKYWYFLRKRGHYHISMHHPHVDDGVYRHHGVYSPG